MNEENKTSKEDKIDQALLKQLLHYDPDTGIFTNNVFRGRRALKGARAGTNMNDYRTIRINDVAYLAHRLAWMYVYGSFPDGMIDHMDGNGHNNRISNLRIATPSQNGTNSGLSRNNTSGFRGVTKGRSTKKPWQAQIKVNGKLTYLGTYETPELAYEAYMFAAEHVREAIDFHLMRDKLSGPKVTVLPYKGPQGDAQV